MIRLEGDGEFNQDDDDDDSKLTLVTISKAKLYVMKYSKQENVHELVLSFPHRIQSPSSSDRSQGSPVQPTQQSVEKTLSGELVLPLKIPRKNP